MPEPTKLLSISEAAARLSVSRATIYRMIGAATLTPVYPTPHTPRIPESQVDAIVSRAA